jgi:hypothetical protein
MDLVVAETGRLNNLITVIVITNNSLTVLPKDRLHKLKPRLLQQQAEKTRTQRVSKKPTLSLKPKLIIIDGGYQAYLALWYQAMAAQQQGGQIQGDQSKPPGTA